MLIAMSPVVAPGENHAAKQPFTLVIRAQEPTVKAGSGVSINVHLTNTSNRDLDASANISDMTRVDPNYLFDVRDSSGKSVPRRVYQHPELATGHAIFRTIKPGEDVTDVEDVSRLYDLTHPGKYVIQVSRRISDNEKDGVVQSNAITITVAP
jgi:hypothetical protein